MCDIERMSTRELKECLEKQLVINTELDKHRGHLAKKIDELERKMSGLSETVDTICSLVKEGYRIEFYSYDKYDPQAIYPQEEEYFVGVTKDSIGAKDQIGQNGYIEDRKLSEYLVKAKEAVDKQRGKVLGELIKRKLQGSE